MRTDDFADAEWAHAREAARVRATECGARLYALLEQGAPSTEADVARAQDRALSAAARALEARERLSRAMQWRHERESLRRLDVTGLWKPSVLPSRLDPGPGLRGTGARLRHALDSGAVATEDLWREFVAYGGNVALMEFDAYLNGAWSMALEDLRVLEHLWWEREHLN
jgi:hypothetical protein